MKRKQVTAILMAAVMIVSACMPMNSISASADLLQTYMTVDAVWAKQ